MGYTHECILNKNTPEIREKLESLGIRYKYAFNVGSDSVIRCSNGFYSTCQSKYYKSLIDMFTKATDCGTNEKLFLAIAALRDDSDYMQWFVSGENWYMVTDNRNKFTVLDLNIWHKATVDELIKHFRK